jgi:hypothetical protein
MNAALLQDLKVSVERTDADAKFGRELRALTCSCAFRIPSAFPAGAALKGELQHLLALSAIKEDVGNRATVPTWGGRSTLAESSVCQRNIRASNSNGCGLLNWILEKSG